MPPKTDTSADGDSRLSWVSSIKEERNLSQSPKRESLFSSPKVSPKPSPKPSSRAGLDSDSDVSMDDESKSGLEEEVTVTVVKGKVVTKKPAKRGKRKGSLKKNKSKGDGSRKGYPEERLFGDKPDLISVVKRELEKEGSPISPAFSPQNVPSPITIPALKAAPPPPSPPTSSQKKSPPKPRPLIKESRPHSPLFKELMKPSPPPVSSLSISMPKPMKIPSKPPPSKKPSPKKSPKIPGTSKKKGNISPAKTSSTKSFLFNEPPPPRTPSPRHSPSPVSTPSSPMYSPASSPPDSPIIFPMPPTPAFPSRTHSPPASPPSRQLSEEADMPSRQLSTDEEVETPDKAKTSPLFPALPPMPPTSAQKRGQRAIITETVGSFVVSVLVVFTFTVYKCTYCLIILHDSTTEFQIYLNSQAYF